MTKTIDCINTDVDLIETTTRFRRRSKGPVMFNGCSPLGDVIIIDNISSRKAYDLTGWYIERQTDSQAFVRYTFTEQCILPPLTSIELWTSTAVSSGSMPNEHHDNSSSKLQQEQSTVRLAIKLLTWNTARQWSSNQLFDSHGRSRALFSHQTLTTKENRNDNDE
jgi:hypothetical protein